MAYSLTGTGVAVVLFVLAGSGTSDSGLRVLGASAGAALALAAVVVGICRRDAGVRWDDAAQPSVAPRFFFERRRAERRGARSPVRLAVNGRTCDATVISVSATGVLLRLRGAAGRELRAEVGQPVHIDDRLTGRLARIGVHGVYIDFAIEFDAAVAAAEPTLAGSSLV